jgi:hypothetical protein
MSISVATGSHRFVCGVRLSCGLQGKQGGERSLLALFPSDRSPPVSQALG